MLKVQSFQSVLGHYHKGGSVILWTGDSCLEPGQQVAAVLRFTSRNSKTGPMHQLSFYNVYPDDHPYGEHIGAGCLLCPLRESCYVLAGPNGRFRLIGLRASDFDKMPMVSSRYWSRLLTHSLRVGEYGDGASVPYSVLSRIIGAAPDHTGYTHFWRDADQRLSRFLMASVETLAGVHQAQAAGWRCYYCVDCGRDCDKDTGEQVRRLRAHLQGHNLSDFIVCPFYTHGVTCFDCGLCRGLLRHKSIIAPVHGTLKRRFTGQVA